MTNPIHQWLEGKKKEAEEHPMLDYEGSPVKIYNDTFAQTFDELIAGTPSLLSAMEAEIKEKIGEDVKIDYSDEDMRKMIDLAFTAPMPEVALMHAMQGLYTKGRNQQKGIDRAIIHEVLTT